MAFPPKKGNPFAKAKGKAESAATEKKEKKMSPAMYKADDARDAKRGIKDPTAKKPMPFSPGFKKGGMVKGKC